MIQVKRWLYNLLYDPYSERAKAWLAIGFSIGLAVLGLSLFFGALGLASQPSPAPAYRPVPTVTVAPTVGGCIRFDTAPEYYTSHPNVTPCAL